MTGQPPSACDDFTLTLMDKKRAAMFGGENRSGFLDDLLIVELSKDSVVRVMHGTHTHTHKGHSHMYRIMFLFFLTHNAALDKVQ